MESDRLGRAIVGTLGAVYLLVGLVGFVVTGMDGFAAREGERLLGIFELNPLHNIVHLAIGAALLASLGLRSTGTAAVSGLIGATYALVAILGFFIDDTEADILALNMADHLLHIASAIALLTAAYLLRQPATAGGAVGGPRTA